MSKVKTNYQFFTDAEKRNLGQKKRLDTFVFLNVNKCLSLKKTFLQKKKLWGTPAE